MNQEHERLEHTEHKGETLDASEEARKNLEHAQEKAEKHEARHEVEHIRKEVETKALSSKEITVGEHQETSQQSMLGMQHELKTNAYKHTMQKVRAQLSPTQRKMSGFIHQPIIETVSELSAKTVARPSAILGAGIATLVGSGTVLYMSKHYGFRYNFFIYFVLFGAGFVLGLLIELLMRIFGRRRVSS